MTLLLIGFGAGVVIGFVLCAIHAGGQFDSGYRLGMEAGAGCGSVPVGHRPRWYVKPPDGDWLPTTEAVARSLEDDGWRVLEIEQEAE